MRSDLRLHDEYFLLSHDDYTGKPHVDAGVAAAGLAGALLADLLLARCLDVVDDVLRVRDRTLARAALARDAVGEIDRRSRGVGWWVEYLRRSAQRLTGEAVVSPVTAGIFRSATRYVANDALVAAGPRVRLRHCAGSPAGPAPDPGTAVLAALAVATGLEAVVADAANRAAREGLRVLADGTPSRLRAVVAGVDAAVVRLAMTTRRGR